MHDAAGHRLRTPFAAVLEKGIARGSSGTLPARGLSISLRLVRRKVRESTATEKIMRSPIALPILFASTCALAAPVAYTLDPAHTQVQVSWNHLQYSNPEAGFDKIAGTLMWDKDDITKSSVDVTIAVDSVHSHVPALDEQLRSAKFLDASRFADMRFVSTRVERADKHGRLRISGNLTVHGVTRPVTLDAHFNHAGIYPMLEVPAVGFSATTTIKRADFGVSEGIPYVGDELSVRITAEALEAQGFAKAMKALQEKQADK
jgi:polyisoprenoid-binding protein YceI